MKPLLKLPFGLGVYRREDFALLADDLTLQERIASSLMSERCEAEPFWKKVAEDRQRRLDMQAFKLGDINAYISGVSSRRVSKRKIQQILRGE